MAAPLRTVASPPAPGNDRRSRWNYCPFFLQRGRAGAPTPREQNERQPEQLDAGADQVGRRVAPRVGGPAESRLDDDAARRAEEVVGGQDRGPLVGRYQAVDER